MHSAAYHTLRRYPAFFFSSASDISFSCQARTVICHALYDLAEKALFYKIYPSRYHTHVFSTYSESMGGYLGSQPAEVCGVDLKYRSYEKDYE